MTEISNIEQAYKALVKNFTGTVSQNEPMSRHTTMRVGGPASIHANAQNLADIKLILKVCQEHRVDYLVLGKGANLVFADSGYKGLVVQLGSEFNRVKVDSQRSQIIAGGAVLLARVLQEAYSNSLEGMSFAAGIPASVGGAIASNAGAFGECVCDLISNVKVMDEDGLRLLEPPLKYEYRKGPVTSTEIVVEAVFNLKKGDKKTIKGKTEKYFSKRKKEQPLNYPSSGSIFRNPTDKISAGQLIESCGLKGAVVGNAMISEKHANFIVNKGGAKSADINALISLAKEKVKEKHSISLIPEIKMIGKFNE